MRQSTPRKAVKYNGARPKRRTPRNRRKPNYFLLFNCFLAAAVLSGSVAYALRTPSLAVRKTKIDGVKLANRSLVQNAANTAVGQNIILLKKWPVVAKIRNLSEVKDVKMGRSLPNGVWIKVIERNADAVLSDSHNYCLIQDNGLMFHEVKGPDKNIPFIEVAKCDPVRAGKMAVMPDVRYALEALRSARREGLEVSKISVDPNGDMCLNMKSELYVKLGQPDDIARKMSLLRNALVYKPSIAKDAAYVDLSCPSAPVWKPKDAGQIAS